MSAEILEDLKEAGKHLAKSVSVSAKVGAKAAHTAANIANVSVNTVGTLSKSGLKMVGKVGEESFKVGESVAVAAGMVASSVTEQSAKMVTVGTEVVADAAVVTMRSSGQVYKTAAEQSAVLASAAIKVSTESLGGLLAVIGEKQETWRKKMVAKEKETRNLKVNREIREEFTDELVKILTELTIGIIASINTYMLTLGELRHLIYVDRAIGHIWRGSKGIPMVWGTLRKRSNNAENVEKKVRRIWDNAKKDKEDYERQMKRFVEISTNEFKVMMMKRMQNNRKNIFNEMLEKSASYISSLMKSIEKNYEIKQNEMEEMLGDVVEEVDNINIAEKQQQILSENEN